MLGRFIVRKESFGGIIYDTEKFRYYAIDHEGIEIISEAISNGLGETKAKYINDSEVLEYIGGLESLGFGQTVFSKLKIFNNQVVDKALTAPIKAFLTITDRCNLCCKHCMGAYGHGIEMSLEQIEYILDQFEEAGVCQIGLTGGEPFTHPEIYKIITMIVERGFTLQTTTNGTLIDQNFIDVFQNYMKSCFRLSLSFDGIPELHDSIRGRGAFEKVMNGAMLLKKNGIEFGFNTVINSMNIKSLPEFLQMMFDAEIYSGSFNIIKPIGRATVNNELLLSKDSVTMCQQMAFIRDCIQKFAKMTERTQYMRGASIQPDGSEAYEDITLFSEIGLERCAAGAYMVSVSTNGRLSPCIFVEELLGKQGLKSETIFAKPMLEIWKSNPQFLYMRNMGANNLCKKCSFYQVNCTSVCAAESLYYFGDTSTPMPYCRKNINKYLK